ncbi:MAG TPA: pyridoxamine 5'-phosphate oxidase [Candidatus Hydrogenedentes bacterium]|nr:pyridoxamine 5'-phosphate oxidase [Candidatus Hydrogenedentota bacterium]HOL76161.1 pyridoxamine 5'-phosphate oxidase [Candidatus Hydrogenedentota bacterium]HPO84776.1 pyridoxamine 5'-phosphate oxidase [Candidatus Hydrogenedentota bacterium]
MTIPQPADPLILFKKWFEDAQRREPLVPDAVALATADANGKPNVRMVLLKGFSENGFVFYTNLESVKARELAENPFAALCIHWKTLRRQVRIRGAVEQVTDAEADAYFATRDRRSCIGAWASKQSRPMKARFELEKRIATYAAKYAMRKPPRPPFWSGFRVIPQEMEFWQERAFRLHDRLLYTRQEFGWHCEWLYP